MNFADIDGLRVNWNTVLKGSIQAISGLGQIDVGTQVPVLAPVAYVHGASNFGTGIASIISGFRGGDVVQDPLKSGYKMLGGLIGKKFFGCEKKGEFFGEMAYYGVDAGVSMVGAFQGAQTLIQAGRFAKGATMIGNVVTKVGYAMGPARGGPGAAQIGSAILGVANDAAGLGTALFSN